MCVLYLLFRRLCFPELIPTFYCPIPVCHPCPLSVSVSVPCLSLLPHFYPLPSPSPQTLHIHTPEEVLLKHLQPLVINLQGLTYHRGQKTFCSKFKGGR